MAVDVYPENLMGIISPRISFSNDLQEDENRQSNKPIDVNFPCRLDQSLADSTFDFAFNVDTSISFQSSTADELFSNGKILTASRLNKEEEEEEEEEEEIKIVPVQTPGFVPCLDPPVPAVATETKKKSLKEFLQDSIEDEEEEQNTTARSFWKFRRSNSLNCDRNQKKGLTGSWKILSRSGSTGKFLEKIVEEDDIEKSSRKSFWKFSRTNSLNSDVANVNCQAKGQSGSSKILRRNHSRKDDCQFVDCGTNLKPFRRSSSLNCDTIRGANQGLTGSDNFLLRSYSTGSAPKKQQQFAAINAKSSQKRQVKSNGKGYGYGNYNRNVRVSPVLNLPSPYISRVRIDLFGFGSLFCNGNAKDRRKRK